jgi:hypothetical protein
MKTVETHSSAEALAMKVSTIRFLRVVICEHDMSERVVRRAHTWPRAGLVSM